MADSMIESMMQGVNFHQRKDEFIKELKALGEKYQIALVGTCEYESIYGEITVVDITDPSKSGWSEVEERYWNFND
jgi:hypothetical protein